MTSRSLLTGLINSSSRALTSAVASSTPIAAETENTTNEDYELVTTGTNKTVIEFIEKNYGSHSSAKNYHLIDGNINVYNSVYENVQNILNAIKTPELVTLITAIQELSIVIACGFQLTAKGFKQPNTLSIHEPSSVLADESKFHALGFVQPYANSIHKIPPKSVFASEL